MKAIALLIVSAFCRKLLSVDSDQPIQLSDLLRILGESNFSPFHRALSHLTDFGGEFTLQIPVFNDTLYLEIRGRSVNGSASTPGYINSISSQRQMIILCLTDVTEAAQEKNQYQSLHKEKNQEVEMLRILVDVAPHAFVV